MSEIVFRNGNQVNSAVRDATKPAPTIYFGQSANKIAWLNCSDSANLSAFGEPVSVADAATLQSYPDGFIWCGSRPRQYLQIGNAVPPRLAQSVLEALYA